METITDLKKLDRVRTAQQTSGSSDWVCNKSYSCSTETYMINKQNKSITHYYNFAVTDSFIFNFLALWYLQFEVKFMIFSVLKFLKVRYVR